MWIGLLALQGCQALALPLLIKGYDTPGHGTPLSTRLRVMTSQGMAMCF